MRVILCALAASFAFSPAHATDSFAAEGLVIRGATLIDGTGGDVVESAVIVIENGLIATTGREGSVDIDPRLPVLDAAGKFLVPGLVEAHGHIDHPNGLDLTPQQKALARLYAPAAFLYNGVTTVVNLSSGDPAWVLALRERAHRSGALLPRILAGEHLTVDDGWGARHGGAVTEITDAVERVDRLAESGYDLTKIIYEDGLVDDPAAFPRMSAGMLAAISQRSRERGLPVFIHAIDEEEYRHAIRVRPRAIVHGMSSRTEAVASIAVELRDQGVYVVPTLVLFEAFTRFIDDATQFEDPYLSASVPPFVIESVRDREKLGAAYERMDALIQAETAAWARETRDVIVANTRRFAETGVRLATGSDAGGAVVHAFQGYSTPRELLLLAQCCLSPMEAIIAGSRTGAAMIGRSGEFGTIEPGKSADILILNANPLADIRNIRDFDRLVVRGRLIDRSSLAWENYRASLACPWEE